jgi:hypothetical protein
MIGPKLPLIAILVFGISFSACGGGGGGSDSTPAHLRPVSTYPTNQPPGTPDNPDDPPDEPKTEVEQQRAIWVSQGISNYRYTLQRTVFSGPQYTDPVVVTVQGGQVVSRTYATTGQPVNVPDPSWWPAIDGLFDIIEDARNRNAPVADAGYDPVFGYPTWGDFDYNLGLADDEHSFNAGSLVQLP